MKQKPLKHHLVPLLCLIFPSSTSSPISSHTDRQNSSANTRINKSIIHPTLGLSQVSLRGSLAPIHRKFLATGFPTKYMHEVQSTKGSLEMKQVNHSKGKVGVRNTSLEASRRVEETPTGSISAAEATSHTQDLNIHPSNQQEMDLKPTYKTKKHVTEKKGALF